MKTIFSALWLLLLWQCALRNTQAQEEKEEFSRSSNAIDSSNRLSRNRYYRDRTKNQINTRRQRYYRGGESVRERVQNRYRTRPPRVNRATISPTSATPSISPPIDNAQAMCSSQEDGCRLSSNYCGGCNCGLLSKGQSEPACDPSLPVVLCIRDPCEDHFVACNQDSRGICEAKACPKPDQNTTCTGEIDSMTCGEFSECTYQNQCLANAAGYNEATCEPTQRVPVNGIVEAEIEPKRSCPESDSTVMCIQKYDPVGCGKSSECTYQNQCLANAAGYNEATCEPTQRVPVNGIVEAEIEPKPSCPESDSTVRCIQIYDPVSCGESSECTYQNQCFANAAGYDETTCKSPQLFPVNGIVEAEIEQKPWCPESDATLMCIQNYDPVKCGEFLECTYSNQCLANAAGYKETCEPAQLVLEGDTPGAVGESCTNDTQCNTGNCLFPIFQVQRDSGTCHCMPGTVIGCEAGHECYSMNDIAKTKGLADSPDFCLLPHGAACDPKTYWECASDTCGASTRTCQCNERTNWPCEGSEICQEEGTGDYACKAPPGAGIAFILKELNPVPVPSSPLLRAIGASCTSNTQCVTDNCVTSFQFQMERNSGICLCNSDNSLGCEDGHECYSMNDQETTKGIADSSNQCLLPHGAACDPRKPYLCASDTCGESTNKCQCNERTHWPCKPDERCRDEGALSFSCQRN